MGTALIKLKIMPDSPQTDLEEIQLKAGQIIEENQGEKILFERQPIAFGLTAIIASFSIDESIPTSPFETETSKIEGVSSVEITDFRRAFG
jgi:translation elongation factor aEF-1 beta